MSKHITRYVPGFFAAVVGLTCLGSVGDAQSRTEVTIADTGVTPENLTSGRDGTVYFGSMAKGTIYRAAPGAARAEPWILASATGLTNVLGVLADDRTNTLWVCQNATGGRGGAPVVGQTALRSFDLTSGAPKGTYPFPPNAGICNDIAVAADGTAYVSESFRGRIHRLRPGATQLEVWVADQQLDVIDGLALLADGGVYANNFSSGKLYRISVNTDGTAGPLVPIETSLPLVRPDGLRAAGPKTLIQAEQQGRVAELTIDGSRASVRVVREGLPRASGVTVVGDSAFVYAGVYLQDYKGSPEGFRQAMQAARDYSQGVMLFDLVHLEENGWWSILEQEFRAPCKAPAASARGRVRHHSDGRQAIGDGPGRAASKRKAGPGGYSRPGRQASPLYSRSGRPDQNPKAERQL